jgi:hypothetical protein
MTSGSALITWDTVTNVMTVNATFAGLTTGNTAAHIHCCIDAPSNAGVATTVPTFTGFPTGATSGTYSHAFDMLSQVFTDLTGLQSGDTLGILKGKTVSGTPILGQQAIVPRP